MLVNVASISSFIENKHFMTEARECLIPGWSQAGSRTPVKFVPKTLHFGMYIRNLVQRTDCANRIPRQATVAIIITFLSH